MKNIFVGRERELKQLDATLFSDEVQTKSAVVCNVQGMPGVGKTCLVEEFFDKRRKDFPGGLIRIVLKANSSPEASGLIAQIADNVKLPSDARSFDERLEEALKNARPLIHIENVDNPELAEVAAEVAKRVRGASLVITGRFSGFPASSCWKTIVIHPFSKNDGVKQLSEELKKNVLKRISMEECQKLVDALGGLPLAIHLAAGYLNAGHDVESFLSYFKRQNLSIAPFSPNDDNYKERTKLSFDATIKLSMDILKNELSKIEEVSIENFCYLGLAPRTGFGIRLAMEITGLKNNMFRQLIVTARSLSLINEMPKNENANTNEAWLVHPLIAEHLRNKLNDKTRKVIKKRIDSWFVGNMVEGNEKDRAERWTMLDDESKGFYDWLLSLPTEEARKISIAGLEFAMAHGPYHTWIEVANKGMENKPDDETKSWLLWCKGNLAQRAGEIDMAFSCAEKKEKIELERGNDREVALAVALKADILLTRGDLDEALRIRKEEQLPFYERLGDMRSRAVTMGKIADILYRQGDLDEALRTLQEDILPAFERLGDVQARAVTLGKIADILCSRGELDEALRTLQEEILPAFERLGDVRSRAVTIGKIADILYRRGDLDETLRIRREEELPVYKRLGDVRSCAITLGKIADILCSRGDLGETLRTLREDVLPAFERLGDVRSRAVTMAKIANILFSRGDLDDALRTLQEDVLPTFERLGDVRERAVTMGKIADILYRRGEFDEALRTLQEDVLPAFERLGDVQSRAVTMGQVADILYRRGEFSEALRTLQEDVLPAFERLGDVQSRAVTMGQIADILCSRGDLDEALRTLREDVLPAYERLGDVRSRAITLGQIADIHYRRGDLDDALRTLQGDVLPAFERLGDMRSLLVARTNLAQLLAGKRVAEDVKEAHRLLSLALDDARRLKLPEAEQIETLMKRLPK